MDPVTDPAAAGHTPAAPAGEPGWVPVPVVMSVIRVLRPCCGGLALLLALAGPSPARAERQERQERLQQDAAALLRLSPPDQRRYLEGLRQLERRSADQRQSQLLQLERCLQRSSETSAAQACLWQARQEQGQQRRQAQGALMALRQRYGLPVRTRSPQPAAAVPYGWF